MARQTEQKGKVGKDQEMNYDGALNGSQIGFSTFSEFIQKHGMSSEKEAFEYVQKYHPEWLKKWARLDKDKPKYYITAGTTDVDDAIWQQGINEFKDRSKAIQYMIDLINETEKHWIVINQDGEIEFTPEDVE